jgi:predicted RNA polymerase sigma factor
VSGQGPTIEPLLRELAPQVLGVLAAVHDEAARAQDTDWAQILALYDLLAGLAPGPMVSLNRVVAIAMTHGAAAGLRALAAAEDDPALARHHRVPAVRAHLLEMTGDRRAASGYYRLAAQRALNVAEQRYLSMRADRATGPEGPRAAAGLHLLS